MPFKSPLSRAQKHFLLVVTGVLFLWPSLLPSLQSRESHALSSSAVQAKEYWYVIKISGSPVGYIHEEAQGQTSETGESQAAILATFSEMQMVLNRMGSRIELRFTSHTEESPAGHLKRVSSEMTASNQTVKAEASVKVGFIELRSEAGGKTYSRTLNYAGELYGPEGIRAISAAKLKNPGDSLAIQTFVAEASLVSKLTRTVIGGEVLSLGGKEMTAVKLEETLEGMPTKRTIWLDELGSILKQEEPGPFGPIEVLRSDKAGALAAASDGELPEEMYQRSIVPANIRLPQGQSIDRLRLKLDHKNPSLGWPDMDSSNQKVLEQSERILVLEIRRPQPAKKASFPVPPTEQNRQYLAPNAFIQSDDSEIQRLAREVVGPERNIFPAALLLEQWVAENMQFDLGIVFAPATEIIRDRRGTCIGYATILATLARAVGIPSRVVMGYVYALGMFGGHAWTEILVGEEWIPLDAAIVNDGAADAKRFCFIASSFQEGLGELSLGSAQQIFSQINIEILEYQTVGKTFRVPPEAIPYSVAGNRYENPWLKIRLDKPRDFAFAELDSVWPNPTLLALKGPAEEKAALTQKALYPWQKNKETVWKILDKSVPGGRREKAKISGLDALILTIKEDTKAALAVRRGLELLILTVEARDASSLLRQIGGQLKIGAF